MALTPKDNLIAGRLLFRKAAPYFQRIIHKLVVVEMPGVGTIATTDNGFLLWDPAFIGKLTPAQVAFCWAHEGFHVWGEHGKRRGNRDPRTWNEACDLAINCMCDDFPDLKPPGDDFHGFWPEDFGWERGLTADTYYQLLMEKQEKEQGQPGDGQPGDGQPGEGGGDGQQPDQGDGGGQHGNGGDQAGDDAQSGADGKGDGEGGHQHGTPKVGGGWCGSCAGRPVPNEPKKDDPDGRTPAEMARARRQVAEAIVRTASKGRGHVPAGLLLSAEGMLQPPKVPWDQQLRRHSRRAVAHKMGAVDYRYDMPSRRQAAVGFGIGKPVMPRLRNPKPETSFVIDTSGSMGRAETLRALSEAEAVMKSLGVPITFLACDAETHGLQRVQSVKQVVLKGGGGTDFRPVFKTLDKAKPRPAVVIFATDGQGPAPAEAPIGMHVIWLLLGGSGCKPSAGTYGGGDVAYGDFITVDEEEDKAA